MAWAGWQLVAAADSLASPRALPQRSLPQAKGGRRSGPQGSASLPCLPFKPKKRPRQAGGGKWAVPPPGEPLPQPHGRVSRPPKGEFPEATALQTAVCTSGVNGSKCHQHHLHQPARPPPLFCTTCQPIRENQDAAARTHTPPHRFEFPSQFRLNEASRFPLPAEISGEEGHGCRGLSISQSAGESFPAICPSPLLQTKREGKRRSFATAAPPKCRIQLRLVTTKIALHGRARPQNLFLDHDHLTITITIAISQR